MTQNKINKIIKLKKNYLSGINKIFIFLVRFAKNQMIPKKWKIKALSPIEGDLFYPKSKHKFYR